MSDAECLDARDDGCGDTNDESESSHGCVISCEPGCGDAEEDEDEGHGAFFDRQNEDDIDDQDEQDDAVEASADALNSAEEYFQQTVHAAISEESSNAICGAHASEDPTTR